MLALGLALGAVPACQRQASVESRQPATDPASPALSPPAELAVHSERPSPAPEPESPQSVRQLVTSGLTCPIRCPREIRQMLETVPGVRGVQVDYDRKVVSVSVEAGTGPEELVAAVKPPYAAELR